MMELVDEGPVCIESTFLTIRLMENYLKSFEYFLLVSCFFSTFLQIYVLVKAVKYIRRATGDECLHVFLLSMTMGDLLLTSFCYPIEQLREQEIIKPPQWINVVQHFLTWLGLSASSASLILLNADKLMYFKFPLRYANMVTSAKGISLAVFVWFGCGVFVSLCWWLECFTCEEDCRQLMILPNKVVMYIVFTVSACIAPSLTSLGVAIYILNVVTSHRSKLSDGKDKKLVPFQQSFPENGNSSHALATRLRTFYFIFMTTIFTVGTLLPYRIYNIQRQLTPREQGEEISCGSIIFSWTCLYFVSLNAILNPIITVTVLPQYRFQWMCKKISSNPATTAVYV
uniref:G_PROTEIN_RECEP_F1_2 domain-containing protein n=1 Tax=Caenorhabditis tropicalis TaxID=1561998 RepID=A0A1I7URT4_9PELO